MSDGNGVAENRRCVMPPAGTTFEFPRPGGTVSFTMPLVDAMEGIDTIGKEMAEKKLTLYDQLRAISAWVAEETKDRDGGPVVLSRAESDWWRDCVLCEYRAVKKKRYAEEDTPRSFARSRSNTASTASDDDE